MAVVVDYQNVHLTGASRALTSCAPSLWSTWPARVATTSSSSLPGTPISLPPSTTPPVPPERRSRPSSGSTRPIDGHAVTSAPRPRSGPPRWPGTTSLPASTLAPTP